MLRSNYREKEAGLKQELFRSGLVKQIVKISSSESRC